LVVADDLGQAVNEFRRDWSVRRTRPHYDVVLPDTSDGTLVRLDTCFDPAVPNPGRRLEP
jgi:hypothetical protein